MKTYMPPKKRNIATVCLMRDDEYEKERKQNWQTIPNSHLEILYLLQTDLRHNIHHKNTIFVSFFSLLHNEK